MNFLEREIILFASILDDGKGSTAINVYKKSGATGGTIFLGYGTIEDKLLNFLGISESRKEIALTLIDRQKEDDLYKNMEEKFQLNKINHGIAFSIPLKYVLGINRLEQLKTVEEGKSNMKVEAIFIIVDKNKSEDVIDAARKAGSRGGTVIHGRGSGTTENAKLFNMEIEPEKDIVLILSKEDETEKIVNGIKVDLNIEEPGAGIIFVVDVTRSAGLYRD